MDQKVGLVAVSLLVCFCLWVQFFAVLHSTMLGLTSWLTIRDANATLTMDSKGAADGTALEVATALLEELQAVKGTTSWQRKLVSCVSQIHTTLKDTAGIKMTSILRDKILQLHMVLARALAIVVQHGSFESKFLHAQWDREMTVSLRHLWKFHIELLLAVRLQEEVSTRLPGAEDLPLGADLGELPCDMGPLDLDAESSEGSFSDFRKLTSQL